MTQRVIRAIPTMPITRDSEDLKKAQQHLARNKAALLFLNEALIVVQDEACVRVTDQENPLSRYCETQRQLIMNLVRETKDKLETLQQDLNAEFADVPSESWLNDVQERANEMGNQYTMYFSHLRDLGHEEKSEGSETDAHAQTHAQTHTTFVVTTGQRKERIIQKKRKVM